MIISVLVPSIRSSDLENFLTSLYITSENYHSLDIVINTNPYPDGSKGKIFEDTFKRAKGDWILFANDDVTMKTKNWDRILKNKVSEVNDEIALFWPDDTMFGDRLACFPIVSKRAMEIANDIWPMPFHTYKIDDELRDIFPLSRRFFIPEIIMKHHNDKGEVGYHLPDGRCYPNNLPVLHADDELFMGRQNLRTEIREKLQREIR